MTISKEITFDVPWKISKETVETIPGPVEGQVCYDGKTGLLMVFNGSEWKYLGEWDMLWNSVEEIENEKFENGYIP